MIFWGEEREGARDAEDEVPKCGEHPRRARLAQAHVRELTAQWALGGRARRGAGPVCDPPIRRPYGRRDGSRRGQRSQVQV
jgi:hypothetical protein